MGEGDEGGSLGGLQAGPPGPPAAGIHAHGVDGAQLRALRGEYRDTDEGGAVYRLIMTVSGQVGLDEICGRWSGRCGVTAVRGVFFHSVTVFWG